MAETKRLVDALVRSRRGSLAGGIAAGAALGGLALIAGLGYRVFGRETAAEAGRRALKAEDVSDDEAALYLRAMVAATLADGMIDAQERARLDAAMDEADLDAAGRRDLERLIADPPAVDEIADRVSDPDAAARVYAAARLAIDPDTVQERTFLGQLADALDLDADAVARVEAEAGA
ncbi:DUF533 domain-containing protein [Methylobacterium oryzisoli]|uniref:DUF533 domain-containing protein n=1 Tax=Methylobacterium oryzisoli TaxID=3385502 RepID=UPI00389235ED